MDTRYLVAPAGYRPHAMNPFSPGGAYGPSWSCFYVASQDDTTFMGRLENGLFLYQFSEKACDIPCKLADFVRHENTYGRSPIIALPGSMAGTDFVDQVLRATPMPHHVRDSDPRFIVHSADLRSGREILRDGALKSWKQLVRENRVPVWHTLRSSTLQKPPEYENFIYFGGIQEIGCEIVTATHLNGRFENEHAKYQPGIRFYFDAHKIIAARLDVRVVGSICACETLPLNPYLVAAVGLDDVDPDRRVASWTPLTFTAAANDFFARRVVQQERMDDSNE